MPNVSLNFDLFPWNPGLACGIEEIDQQHAQLVALINQLARQFVQGAGRVDLNQTLKALVEYTDYHFRSEEALWQKWLTDSAHYLNHKKSHESFIEQVIRWQSEDWSSAQKLPELLGFLCHWLAAHILGSDRQLALLVLEQQNQHFDASTQPTPRTALLNLYEQLSAQTLRLLLQQQNESSAQTSQYQSIGQEITDYLQVSAALQQRNQELSALLNHLPNLIWLKDAEGRYLRCNARTASLWGIPPEAVLGRIESDLIGSESAALSRAQDLQAVASGQTLQYEQWFDFADGHRELLQVRKTPLFDEQGQLLGVLGSAHDITLLKQQQNELERQRQHLQTAIEAAEAGTWEWNVRTDQTTFNERWAQMLGYSLEDLGAPSFSSWKHRIHPEDLPGALANLQQHLKGERDSYNCEYRIQHRNGLWLWRRSLGRISQRDEQGQPLLVAGIDLDITSYKEHHSQLEFLSRHDPLTGLANRSQFTELLNQCMAQAKAGGQHLAVAYLDLDDFTQINQTHGRALGDRLLKEITRRLQDNLREPRLLARTGGDEFAIALTGLNDPHSYSVPLDRLLSSLSETFREGALELSCSASIGVTLYPQEGPVDAEQLLRQADQAMYQAKLIGKNRYTLFDAARDESTRVQFVQLEEIRKALEQQQFVLYYQPKINLRTGQVLAFEALIRWQHPERGLLAPGLFIPVISSQPLGIEVGDWVLEEALRQLDQWQAQGLSTAVSVNLESNQLHSPDFAEQIFAKLRRHPKLRPEQLRLEILETSALEDMPHVSQLVRQLQSRGIEFALDDFGTGYSSLTFLKQLSAKTLKIDQSFIRQALEDPEQIMIIDSVLGLARSFDREVIAEGVETEAHGKLLIQMGYEHGQGYAIARPMPASEVSLWLARWQVPSSWRNAPVLSRSGLTLLLAELNHQRWIKDLEAYLHQQRATPPEVSLEHCRFGRWLNRPETLKRYREHPNFSELKDLHHAVHLQATQILQQHYHQNEQPALFEQLHSDSFQLLCLLQKLREQPSSF